MLSTAELKALPTKQWMSRSKTPKMWSWLGQKQSEEDKNRLGVCGNIVLPEMASFAMHCLHAMR